MEKSCSSLECVEMLQTNCIAITFTGMLSQHNQINKKTKYNYYFSEFQLYFTSCFFIRLIVFLHIFHIIHAFHFLGFVQITVCQILLFFWEKKKAKKFNYLFSKNISR